MFLGNEEMLRNKYFHGFTLYFHEKDQFWQPDIPNVKRFDISSKSVTEFTFSVVTKESVYEEDRNCTYDESFSFSKCMEDYIHKELGCSLNWFSSSDYKKCNSQKKIFKRQALYNRLKAAPYEKLSFDMSKCFQKCNAIDFEIKIKSKEDITWETEWISEVDFWK